MITKKRPKKQKIRAGASLDPSRTGGLRRQFNAMLKRRLDAVKVELIRGGVLSELTYNVFCPTGVGGGIDPTCSPRSVEERLLDLREQGYSIRPIEWVDSEQEINSFKKVSESTTKDYYILHSLGYADPKGGKYVLFHATDNGPNEQIGIAYKTIKDAKDAAQRHLINVIVEASRFDLTENEDNCGTGAGGFKPGNTCAKETDHGIRFKKVRDEVEMLEKHGLTPLQAATLAGALPGSHVSVWVDPDLEDGIEVVIDHPEYHAHRYLLLNKTILNNVLRATKTGTGLGTNVFHQQVTEAAKHGYTSIETYALKTNDHNGHYTWARLGYDGEVKDIRSTLVDSYAARHGLTKVSDFMKSAEHRAWWKEFGSSFEGSFDLTEGSLSRRVLDAYVAERNSRRGATHNVRRGGSDPRLNLGLTGLTWQEPDQQVKRFEQWFTGLLERSLLTPSQEDAWAWLVETSFNKGASRSYDEVVAQRPKQDPQRSEGARGEFLRGLIGQWLKPEMVLNMFDESKHPRDEEGKFTESIETRLDHPASRLDAENRMRYTSDALFGIDTNPNPYDNTLREIKLPGGRFIQVSLKEAYGADQPFMAQIDFGIVGESNTLVGESLSRDSLSMLRKVKEAVQKYHQEGFRIKIVPSDTRRKDIYEKQLTKMGLKKEFESSQGYLVFNEVLTNSLFGRATSKLKLLAVKAFNDVRSAAASLIGRATRVVTDGLATGKSEREITSQVIQEIKKTEESLKVTVSDTAVGAHAEGQLAALEDLGIAEVNVAVEWAVKRLADGSIAPNVCKLCRVLDGIVLKVSEARGLLPRHPRCQCAFVTPKTGAKTSKGAVVAALQRSRKRGWPKKAGPIKQGQGWAAGVKIAERRPQVNAFNPNQPRDEDGKWVVAISKLNSIPLAEEGYKTFETPEDQIRLKDLGFIGIGKLFGQRLEADKEKKLYTEMILSPDQVHYSQSSVVKDAVHKKIIGDNSRDFGSNSKELPLTVVEDGVFYLQDGHHRAAAEILKTGKFTTNVIEAVKQGTKRKYKKPAPQATTNQLDDLLLKFSGLLNVFCATGEGGGVDPTCSPGKTSINFKNLAPALQHEISVTPWDSLNPELRDPSLIRDRNLHSTRLKRADALFTDATRLHADEKFIRGVSGTLYPITPGETFTELGYLRLSNDQSTAEGFSGRNGTTGQVLHLTVPKGSKALPGDHVHEHEVYLPRGSKFSVDRVESKENGLNVFGEMQYIHHIHATLNQ